MIHKELSEPPRPHVTIPDGRPPEVVAECQGWLDGTGKTYRDKSTRVATEGGFTAQGRQDRAMFETLFMDRGENQGAGGGVYVDLAANHYKRISNTYFYDQCLGWRGLCFEPNPIYHKDIERYRTCSLIKTCVSNTTEQKRLILPNHQWEGGLGGIGGGKLAYYRKPVVGLTLDLNCVTLGEELARRSIDHVDMLSLDVEGHEEQVLGGINFAMVRIDHIVCEAGCESLLSQGYVKHVPKLMGETGDIVYTHPSVFKARRHHLVQMKSCVHPKTWHRLARSPAGANYTFKEPKNNIACF